MSENNVSRSKIKDFDIIEDIDKKILRFKEYKEYLEKIANNTSKIKEEKYKGKQSLPVKLKEKQSSLFISKNFFNHVNEKINRLESSFIFNDSIKYKKFNINSIDKEIDNDAKKELKYKKTIRRSVIPNKNVLSEEVKLKEKKNTKISFIKKDSLDSYFDKLNNLLFRNNYLEEDNKISNQFGTDKDNSKFFINEENKILNRSRLRNSNSNSNFNTINSMTNFGKLTNHMNKHNISFLNTKTIRDRDTNKDNDIKFTNKDDTIIDKVRYFKEKFNNLYSKNIKSVNILNRIIKDERKINENKAIINNLESKIETMCLSTINKTELERDKYPFKHKSNKIISNTSQHLNTTLSSKDKQKSKFFLEYRDEDEKRSSTIMKLKENSKKVKANFEKYLKPFEDKTEETEKETKKNVNKSYNYNNIRFSKKDRGLLEKVELKNEKIIQNCYSESIFDFKKTINSQLTSKTKEEIRNINESSIKNINKNNKRTIKNDNSDELEEFLCEEEIKKYLLETNSTFKDVNKFLMRNKIEKSNSFIVKDNRNDVNDNEIEIIKKNSKNYQKLKSCILKKQMIMNRKNKLIDQFNNKNEKKIIIPSSSMKNIKGKRLNILNSLNNKSIEVEKKLEGKGKENKMKKLKSNYSSPYKTIDNENFILFNPNKMNLKEHKNRILNYDYYFSHTNLIDNVGNSKLKELIIKNIKDDKVNYDNPQNLYNNKEFKKNKVILTTKGNTNDIMFIQSLDDETIYRLRKHILKKYGIDMDNSIFNNKNEMNPSKEKKNEELDELYKLGINKKYCNEGMFKILHSLENNYLKTNKLIHKLSKNII